jgi:hypothetical protein
LDVPALITPRAEKVRIDGFEKTDSFKKYKEEFSHLVDLSNLNDAHYLKGISSSKTPTAYMDNIRYDSSCYLSRDRRDDYIYTTYNYILYANIKADVDGVEVDGLASIGGRNAVVRPSVKVDTVMHEFGHITGLYDEDEGEGSFDVVGLAEYQKGVGALKNCSFDPLSDFAYSGKLYGNKPGDSTAGCLHGGGVLPLPTDDPRVQAWREGKEIEIKGDTPTFRIYRPTPTSLMNYSKKDKPRDNRLNIPSCGFAIAWIKGGQGPEYFPECMGLDTVKPIGIVSTLSRERLLASIAGTPEVPQGPAQGGEHGGEVRRGLIFENDVVGKGVIWYDGEPMPPSLKFVDPDASLSLPDRITNLRARVEELSRQRDGLKFQLQEIRRQRNYAPLLPTEKLNAAPIQRQLGDITESLKGILGTLEAVMR